MKMSLLLFSVFCAAINVSALPAKIVIIRHGEKIDDSHQDLSPMGCERAYQLTNFFKNFKLVSAIYAQGMKKSSSSIRPLETIAPTAKMLGLKINNSFLKSDTDAVTNEIMSSRNYDGKTVVISWEHSAIIDLATAFGVKLSAQLQSWPGKVFDQAWIITYPTQNSKQAELQIIAEHVLPTDILNEQSGIANWGSEETSTTNDIVVPVEVIKECSSGNQALDQMLKSIVTQPLPQ